MLLHAGPGAGKTLGALLAFQQLQREGRLDRFVVFCHRSAIARQWISAASRLGLVLQEWDIPGGAPSSSPGQGLLLSYQAAALHRLRHGVTSVHAGGAEFCTGCTELETGDSGAPRQPGCQCDGLTYKLEFNHLISFLQLKHVCVQGSGRSIARMQPHAHVTNRGMSQPSLTVVLGVR